MVFTHVVENIIGCSKKLGEYPTNLTQTKALLRVARDPIK